MSTVKHLVNNFQVWVNQLALNEAGITSASQDPEGGKILKNSQGQPNGKVVRVNKKNIHIVIQLQFISTSIHYKWIS